MPLSSTDNIPLHDPGFTIFAADTADTAPHLGVGIGTPKSKRTVTSTTSNPESAPYALAHIPSSASSSRSNGTMFDDDQENIPPVWSLHSTPSKHSVRSSPSKHGASEYGADEEIFSSPGGSGRRKLRTIERSKLGLGSVLRGEISGEPDEDGEEDELTPGRREGLAKEKEKGKGKARMAREVDRI